MKAVVSNKHGYFNHPRKMKALYIFQIVTPILTSKQQKIMQLYFLEANRAMCRNRIISSPKCRKWTSANT